MRILLGIALFGLATYLIAGYLLSSLILEPPPRRSTVDSNEALAEGWGYNQDSLLQLLAPPESVTFISSPSELELHAWYFRGAEGARCGAVLAHGITENRANTLKYAAMLRDCGCHMLLFDQRCHGASEGHFLTGSASESDDVLAAHAFLARRAGIAPNQIALIGESWGASAVLVAAAKTNDIAFVLADSPFTSWHDAIVQRADKQYGTWLRLLLPATYAWVEWRTGVDMNFAAPREAAAKISVPTLLMHVASDTVTPAFHSREIAAQLDSTLGGVRILSWPAWHAHGALYDPVAYRTIVDSFLLHKGVEWCH